MSRYNKNNENNAYDPLGAYGSSSNRADPVPVGPLPPQATPSYAAGWRACIDHIIRPDSPCPVCEIEKLRAASEKDILQIVDLTNAKVALEKRVAELEAEVEKALAFGYHYRQHPQMRGSSLHACREVYRELAGERDD